MKTNWFGRILRDVKREWDEMTFYEIEIPGEVDWPEAGPVTDCHLCNGPIFVGNTGNPYTLNGDFYYRDCNVCQMPVCENCCHIAVNSSDTAMKICNICYGEGHSRFDEHQNIACNLTADHMPGCCVYCKTRFSGSYGTPRLQRCLRCKEHYCEECAKTKVIQEICLSCQGEYIRFMRSLNIRYMECCSCSRKLVSVIDPQGREIAHNFYTPESSHLYLFDCGVCELPVCKICSNYTKIGSQQIRVCNRCEV